MTTRAVLVLLAAWLGGCAPSRSIAHFRGSAMGTSYSIKAVLSDDIDRALVRAEIDSSLAAFNTLFSTYDETSEISRFNAHRGDQPFLATRPFVALVGRALQLAEQTGGAFDPTVGPLLRLYGFGSGATEPGESPSPAAIEAARSITGWQRLRVEGASLYKHPDTVELDLNAIAKGAGVDQIARTLDGMGSPSYMVEIGGEVRCKGVKPGGVMWRLGIAQPDGAGYAEKVDLLNAAMATSGSYLQVHSVGGAKVHHILDPRTGRNAQSPAVSVTVVAPTCELADGLATALMVLGPEAGISMMKGLPAGDVKMLVLCQEAGGLKRYSYRW